MKKIFLVIVCISFIVACKTSKTATTAPIAELPCPKMLYSYNAHIKTIIDANCAGCHQGKRPAHGIDLASYENVKVATTKPSFLGSINHEKGFDKMPAGHAKLDDATIRTIKCWISSGAAN
jgi:mono/diheme cytochrome c family protein